jgi:hypothetical protein
MAPHRLSPTKDDASTDQDAVKVAMPATPVKQTIALDGQVSPVVQKMSPETLAAWSKQKPEPYFQGMPASIIDSIFDNLSDPRDIGNLRRTCKSIGQCVVRLPQSARFVREVTVMPVSRSMAWLSEIAQDDALTDLDGAPLPTSQWVEKVIFEDVFPMELPRILILAVDDPEAVEFYQIFCDSLTLGSSALSVRDLIVDILSRLEQLSVLEYHVSLPKSDLDTDQEVSLVGRLRELPFLSGKQAADFLWDNRAHFFVPTNRLADLKRSAAIFHLMINTVLRQRKRAKSLSVIIKTIHSEAVYEQITSSALQLTTFPAEDWLQSLELRFCGQNMADEHSFICQLRVLSGPATSGQFSSLRRLVLAGKGLHQGWSLNLKDLGVEQYSPTFADLDTLILENVQVSEETVIYMRQLPVDLILRNVFWWSNCIKECTDKSNLRSVTVSGIHVVDFAGGYCSDTDSPYDEEEGINPADLLDRVWRITANETEPVQLADDNAAHCCLVPGWSLAQSMADPDIIALYIQHGGDCPLTWNNVWATSWRLDAESD